MSAEEDPTGRHARLEERVDNVIENQERHSVTDEKRFDKIDGKLGEITVKVEGLSSKVAAMAAVGGIAGAVLQHLLHW